MLFLSCHAYMSHDGDTTRRERGGTGREEWKAVGGGGGEGQGRGNEERSWAVSCSK